MEEKYLLKIKAIFKKYMKENNISIFDLAVLLEVKETTIKTYISGKKDISINFISRFSSLKKLNKEDSIFLKDIVRKYKKISKKKSLQINNNNRLIFMIKELENNLIKQINKNQENSKKIKIDVNLNDESKKILSLKNDYETVNRAIKLMWLLNDESNKYFSELNILLSTNEIKNNLKLKKGLLEISKNLILMGKKLQKIFEEDIIIDL